MKDKILKDVYKCIENDMVYNAFIYGNLAISKLVKLIAFNNKRFEENDKEHNRKIALVFKQEVKMVKDPSMLTQPNKKMEVIGVNVMCYTLAYNWI